MIIPFFQIDGHVLNQMNSVQISLISILCYLLGRFQRIRQASPVQNTSMVDSRLRVTSVFVQNKHKLYREDNPSDSFVLPPTLKFDLDIHFLLAEYP